MNKSSPAVRGLVSLRAETPATPENIMSTLDALARGFEEYKATVDTALAESRNGHGEDVVTTEKIDRISADIGATQAAVDKLTAQMAGAEISSHLAGGFEGVDPDYRKDYLAWFRKGKGEEAVAAKQFDGPRAAMDMGSDAAGGLLAPIEWDRTITDALVVLSPMRQIATLQQISGRGFTKVYNKRGTASGWVSETDARPETNTPTFEAETFIPGEIYANIPATQGMLDDGFIDLESWLAGEVETEFAYQEGMAFNSGDGTDKPKGWLTYTAGASHPLGAVPTVNSGHATQVTGDGLLDLVHDLPSEMAGNARFVMNRATQGTIRKLKDGNGNYLWQPSYVAGQPSTLMGYPLTEMAAMPDVAADALAIGFGDFMRGYLIVDRVGVRILRDPFTNKPYVQFYTTKRVGGGVINPEALRYHKIGT